MRVVIGVDSGGSKTRALAVSFDGEPVGYAETGGGNPSHDSDFDANIRNAILGACGSHAVVAIVSGIAGLDRPSDHEWALKATDIGDTATNRLQVNDADIALFGALEGRPGIICIQGAGSMVLAKTESGRAIRNYDLLHYSNAAAPKTGLRATHAVMNETLDRSESAFGEAVVSHWGVASISELREFAATEWMANFDETRRIAGRLAPLITAAAERGLPTAVRICEQAATEIVEAILLLGPYFEAEEVEVCLSGSCGTSAAVAVGVIRQLRSAKGKAYKMVEAQYTPVQGAAFWALQLAGVPLTPQIKQRVASRDPDSEGCSEARSLE